MEQTQKEMDDLEGDKVVRLRLGNIEKGVEDIKKTLREDFVTVDKLNLEILKLERAIEIEKQKNEPYKKAVFGMLLIIASELVAFVIWVLKLIISSPVPH